MFCIFFSAKNKAGRCHGRRIMFSALTWLLAAVYGQQVQVCICMNLACGANGIEFQRIPMMSSLERILARMIQGSYPSRQSTPPKRHWPLAASVAIYDFVTSKDAVELFVSGLRDWRVSRVARASFNISSSGWRIRKENHGGVDRQCTYTEIHLLGRKSTVRVHNRCKASHHDSFLVNIH